MTDKQKQKAEITKKLHFAFNTDTNSVVEYHGPITQENLQKVIEWAERNNLL